jgi:predicted PurR-regulated permease PerM
MVRAPGVKMAISQTLLDVLIRAGLVAVLAVFCYQVFRPFLNLMLWSIILAVTLYPFQRWLKRKLGNKDGRAATLIVLLGIAVLLVPIYLLGTSIAESAEGTLTVLRSGELHVPPPAPSIADVPVIGESLHAVWQQAATDLTGLAQQHAPQIRAVGLSLVGKLASFGLALLLFIVALILAGIFLAWGEGGSRSAVEAFSRIAGPERGPQIATLCTTTIRAVAQGVIGIAFIQMVLVGAGFVAMGVPGAGLLALAVLFLGIIQAPATILTVPVIALVLATQGADTWTIVCAVYVFVAGLVDNVLKPLLLGRGVSVPMPVVLIGALGGMVTGGVIGLFIGPVILGVGYELFWQWVRDQPGPAAAAPAGTDTASPAG